MSTVTGAEPAPFAAPFAAALAALDADDWAWLLPHARAALASLDGPQVTATVTRLREASAARLAGGRLRTQLCELLAEDGACWPVVRGRLAATEDLPDAVAALLTGTPAEADVADRDPSRSAALDEARRVADRARRSLKEVRAERDEVTRRLDGSLARIRALEAEVDRLGRELDAAAADADALRRELADADADRGRAVERERRRRDAEVAALTEQLAALRRADEQRRSAERREQARREARAAAAHDVPAAAPEAAPTRLVPGRPSRLPKGVDPNTRPAAEALLHPGRLVLIDGYNVTLRHRSELDLASQRRWLVQAVGNLAAARRIRPVVVFDGERSGSGVRPVAARGVEVRFTADGITADDELVFAVEATDEPVVVVTDDRELIDRVTHAGADVLRTAAFLWVTR